MSNEAKKLTDRNLYEISKQEMARVNNECQYHSPSKSQIGRYAETRRLEKHVKLHFLALAPRSRELSIALTDLDKAFMMLRAAIARNESAEHEG